MKTFISAILATMVTFSISASAGFVTGEQESYADGFSAKKLRLNGHAVELGRHIQDVYGNFSDDEVNALIPLLAAALEKLPSGGELRAKHQRLFIEVVKGQSYNVERRAERGFLRVPALTTITLTIPVQAVASDVALFFNENIALTAASTVQTRTNNVADFMKNLVSPREIDGCEMHLLNLLAPY